MTVTRRLSIAAAAAVMAVPALAACGYDAQTNQVYNAGVGVDDRSGAVDVLAVTIVSGSDGSGTLIAGLANGEEHPQDKLVGVSGTGKNSGVQVSMDSRPTIPRGGFVQLADLPSVIAVDGPGVVPGRLVQLTFSFQNAKSITVAAPVVRHADEYATVPLPSSASPTGSESPSESPSTTPSGKPSESPSGTASETATPTS